MRAFTRRTALTSVSASALVLLIGCRRTSGQQEITGTAESVPYDPVPEAPFAISDRVQKYVRGDTLFIEAIQLVLTAKFIRKDLNLVILADTLQINETITIPGKKVTIVAREIACKPGVCIDTSGVRGARYTLGERASPGNGPGVRGGDGGAGDSGTSAGDILIIAERASGLNVLANGGTGGSGESGGNGYIGRQGRPSHVDGNYSDRPTSSSQCSRGQPGGDPEDGSGAGTPGQGGVGGNGGRIVVRLADPASNPSLKADLGKAGGGGSLGTAGRDGEPGQGGHSWKYQGYMHHGCEETDSCYGTCVDLGFEPDGRRGGSYGTGPLPAPVSNGTSYRPSLLLGPTAPDASKIGTLSFADLIISRAELDYIGGDLTVAAQRLVWINGICREAAAAKQPLLAESWLAKDYRTSVLITQMRQCLNYFGADLSWVPPLKTEAFDKTLDLYFNAASALENDSTDLDKYEGKTEAFNQRIGNAVSAASDQIADMEQQIVSSSGTQEQQGQELERLNALAGSLGYQIDQANASFKAAVARKSQQSGGCDVFDQIKKAGTLLTAVKAATVIAGGGLPAFAVVAQTLSSFAPPKDANFLDQMIHFNQSVTGAADTVQQRITQVRDAWGNVKNAFDALQPNQPPPLIKLDRDTYQKTLKDFRELPEAAALGGLLDRYFDVLDARNQGYANIDSLIAQRNQLRVNIKALQAETARLEVLRANANQPGLTEFATILRRRLAEAKRTISVLFAQQARAISYYNAEDVALPALQETRVSVMKDIRARLSKSFLDAKAARGQAKQEFEFSLSFDRNSAPEAFAMLSDKGYLPLIISEGNKADDDDLARWWGVEIKKFAAELYMQDFEHSPGSKVRASLIHMGITSVRGQDGRFRQFTHKRRLSNITLQKSDDRSSYGTLEAVPAGGDQEFIYSSPYGAWRLTIFDPDLALFDRTKVTRIALRFIADGISFGRK